MVEKLHQLTNRKLTADYYKFAQNIKRVWRSSRLTFKRLSIQVVEISNALAITDTLRATEWGQYVGGSGLITLKMGDDVWFSSLSRSIWLYMLWATRMAWVHCCISRITQTTLGQTLESEDFAIRKQSMEETRRVIIQKCQHNIILSRCVRFIRIFLMPLSSSYHVSKALPSIP